MVIHDKEKEAAVSDVGVQGRNFLRNRRFEKSSDPPSVYLRFSAALRMPRREGRIMKIGLNTSFSPRFSLTT
jgi:hypothetical protein